MTPFQSSALRRESASTGHDSGRDNENQDDGQDKNHCTLKHVFILPYPSLKSDKGTRS